MGGLSKFSFALIVLGFWIGMTGAASATPFTTTTPGPDSIELPSQYPEAGGVAIVMVGDNGNVYYQFSDPSGAFVGYQFSGQPAQFRGNPFTINDPIPLDCGFASCSTYFGGGIARMYVRFSAYDGDTQIGGFDNNDISLVMNGVTIGNWSSITTEKTNNPGTQGFGFEQGFGNNTFNTGWFTTTNQTLLDSYLVPGASITTQVLDRDPNDNYWDFRRGPSLGNELLRTIAPGYTFEKTADRSTFSAVGEVVNYTYVVTNIGSVEITDLVVTDDKISNVTCDATTIPETTTGGSAQFATCSGTYTITQADFEAQEVTNIASAQGTPAFGSLGTVRDEVTITGPAFNSAVTIAKTSPEAGFSTVGEVIQYDYVVTNSGNSTLTNLVVTDDKIPGTICTIATLPPSPSVNEATCSAFYTVTQDDIDQAALAATPLTNIASVVGVDPNGAPVSDTSSLDLPGPAVDLGIVVAKSALQQNFDSVGDVLQFVIEVTNTSNVTWPGAPTISDPLIEGAGGSVTCPTGSMIPGQTITCSGSYSVTQPDLNAEQVENIVTAEIALGGETAQDQADVTVPAVVSTGLTLVKRLPSGAETVFDAVGDQIAYEYVVTNTGNVALDPISVVDDKVAVTCPSGALAPGGSTVCSSDAPYTVTQADLDAGSVTNLATASGQTEQGANVDSPQQSLSIQAQQAPELALDKTAPTLLPADFQPGLVVTYSYEITNTGNVTLSDPISVTDDRITGPIDCGTAALAPGASRTCTADYTVTVADFLAGSVTNIATASDGSTTSNQDTAVIPQTGSPALSLAKASDPASTSFTTLGESIDFIFTVTNSGDTNIIDSQPITVNDPLIGSVDCATNQPSILAPGDSFTCEGTYAGVTQAQIDAGEVVNTATASFTAPGGTVTSPSAMAVVPSAIVSAMSLAKTGPAAFGAVGSAVTFTFALTNDSAQTISAAAITDPDIPGLSCSFSDIAPFATVSCTGEYIVTQEDLDLGSITNVAGATGQAPTGESLSATATATVPADPGAIVRSLSLDKTASLMSFNGVGETISYSFAVTNTGTVTLTDILVEDTQLGVSCIIPELAPLATNDTTCRASHVVSQADMDAGFYENTANVSAPGATGDTSSITVPGPTRNAAFEIEKTASVDIEVAVGTVVTYSHQVTNTGNVTLTDITLTDSHTSAAGTVDLTFSPSNVITSLDPGQTATVTTSYIVTQADIDSGADLINSVSGIATPPSGLTPPVATADETVDLEDPAPAISVVKTEQDGTGSFANMPASETFTFEVFNDGNVTVSGLTLTDGLTGFSCLLPPIAPLASATTCGDLSTPLSTIYTITQDDIDRAELVNEVEVTGAGLTATDSVTLVGPAQIAAISLVKDATAGAGFDSVGDRIAYAYVITNEGNVRLQGPFTVDDDKVGVTCPSVPAPGLDPGASLTCTSQYAVTQADLDVGAVTNLATASVTQTLVPGGPAIISSSQVSETVPATQAPALTLNKVITPGTPTTFDEVGDTISYDFTITNSGNVTIPGPLTVDDDQIGPGLSCAAGPLAPGASVTCSGLWSADQAAIDAGSITNTASPVASFGGTLVPSTSDTATALAVQQPEMDLVKAFISVTNDSYAAGETVTYSYTLTNTGNTTITTEPVISDNKITAAPNVITLDGTFPAGGLLPGQILTYTGLYQLTIEDIELGSVTNTATATDGSTVSNPSSVTTPETADPALSIVKTADVTSVGAVGDLIIYTYAVTNTSDGVPAPAFANAITVIDDKFPGLAIACAPTADNQLIVDETTTCTATYMVTQADVDAGEITNSAVASTRYGTGTEDNVFSPAASLTVSVVTDPSLAVEKFVSAGPNPAAAGDVLTYSISATNDGDQTLSNVRISDPMLPALTCTVEGVAAPPIVVLAPGEALLCEGDYTVTQAEIDTQVLANTASASGNSPQGADVTGSDTITHPLVASDPVLFIEKTLAVGEPTNAYSVVGEQLTFNILVRNDGNVTLTGIEVTDALVPGTCSVPDLAPGESDATCSFTYTVTQADVDAGSFVNTATVTAQPASPGTPAISEEDDIVAIGPDPEPVFSLVKSADLSEFSAPGAIITYTYTVANTGNVTITDTPVVVDDKINANAITCEALPPAGLAPLEFIICTGTYVTTQADVDAGQITNIASVSSPSVPFDPLNPGSALATETVPAVQTPGVAISKAADDTTEVVAGQVLTYTYVVENTGNVTLSDIALVDAHTSAAGTSALMISGGGIVPTLAPGITATLTASYTVTQQDIDAGADLTNTVTLTATSPDGSTQMETADEVVSVAAPAPAIEAIKTVASNTGFGPGDTVTFEIAVENTGNVTLAPVTVTDALRRADGTTISPVPQPVLASGDGVALSPAEIWTYEVTHALTQADIDAGGLFNSATVTGTPPNGPSVSDASDNGTGTGSSPTPFVIPADPEIETMKSVSGSATEVGQVARFIITIENTGNVTLDAVAVASDTLTRADGTPLTLTTGPTWQGNSLGSVEGTLQVGETASYLATYTLTQADIDAGGIINVATGTATPPSGPPIEDEVDTPAEIAIDAAPSIALSKALAAGSGPTFDAVGEVLSYAFEVTNTGNVTLIDQIVVSDPLIEGAGGSVACPAPPLAPGDSMTCSGSYSVTQADIDAGSVLNAATATVPGALPAEDEVAVPAIQTPELDLVKTAASLEAADFVTGAVVDYTFTVTNTGNVTLTDPVTIEDPFIPSVTCDALPVDGLAPNGVLECTGTYTITSTDVDLTSFTNLATATSGETTSSPSSDTIPNDGTPALTIAKSVASVTDAALSPRADGSIAEVGDIVTYNFDVTNSGSVAFVNDIVVDDPLLAGALTCWTALPGSDPDFTAGESATCTASYVVTQADLDAGQIVNFASASTTFGPDGTTVLSPSDSATVTVDPAPALEVTKEVNDNSYAAVGEVLTYTVTVTNTGNQTLSNVEVTDPLLEGFECGFATLGVGETETCIGTLTITQADLDAAEILNIASGAGLSPDGTSVGDDSNPVIATAVLTPTVLTLVKTATPDPFGGPGSAVTYGFAVSNAGPFTLFDVTVTDPLVPGFNCTIAQLPVGSTDSNSCTMSYIVTQDDVDAGEITNSAGATGETLFGLQSTAEDTITTPGPDPAPAIEAVKTVEVPATTVGTTLTYTLEVTNTGNVTLDLLNIDDQMSRIASGQVTFLTSPFAYQSGDVDTDGLLSVGETWIHTATYVLTQSDVNAGGVSNTVTVTGVDPNGTDVTDVSDDGIAGNGDDNPTLVPITSDPVIDVVKSILQPGAVAGAEVVFEIEVFNRGNVSISALSVEDQLTRSDGTDLSALVSAPVLVAGGPETAPLDPGQSRVWEVRYTLVQADVDAGGISNLATATGEGPDGAQISDISSDDDPSDGNPVVDPTELVIAPVPALEVVKTVTAGTPVNADDSVTFTITATNSGNVTLAGITLTDDLTNLAGDVLTPDAIVPDPGVSIALLPGEDQVWTVTYGLSQADIDAGGIENTATAAGADPNGLPVTDQSDDGDDGDGNALNDPTQVLVTPIETMTISKSATVPARIAGTVFETVFSIEIANTGNVTQQDISVLDDLTGFVAPATLMDVSAPIVSGFDSGAANATYDGVTATETLAAGTSLLPGSAGTIDILVRYDVAAGNPAGQNTAVLTSARLGTALTDSTGVATAEAEPDILATKAVATPGPYQAGAVITYEVTFTNRNLTSESGLTLVDRLPAGMLYVDGSATFDGAATPAPLATGPLLSWEGITLAPDQTVVISLSALLLEGAGTFTNEAYVLDSTGARVSNTAAATISIAPEPVFDCGDVIGKVFDDRNLNGYQDPPPDARSAITDQDYFADGKFETAPEVIEQQERGEPGIPGVKLVTVTGDIITTDAFGRFHVPCALLPGPTGSNFTLKLDERSLPSGFRPTTENPRTLRLTSGIMTEMNFGAALGRLVDIDLLASAFTPDDRPSAALVQGIDTLLQQIRQTPSVLRITYYRDAESGEVASARLQALEDAIRRRWTGSYPLRIETTIARVQ